MMDSEEIERYRPFLRRIVDEAFQAATEGKEWPSHLWADKLIERANEQG